MPLSPAKSFLFCIASTICHQCKPFRCPTSVFTKKNRDLISCQCVRSLSSENWNFDVDKLLKDEKFDDFSKKMLRISHGAQNVLVIQPYIKYSPKSEKHKDLNSEITTPQLQLDEAVALIHSLPGWRVADSLIIGVPNYNKSSFFGSGQIERLQEKLKNSQDISAIFVSANMLRVRQIISLELELGIQVFDRYTIVIQIFRHHAMTNESKLQVAMAEIPYLRQCVKGFPKGLSDRLESGGIVGGSGMVFIETRKELLNFREQKLKKALNLLKKHRERLRTSVRQSSFPVVAVVGYTNAGKTSLIKALTGTDKLKPRDQLFATLDITKHEGKLPCNLKVLFVDTVGFITDIPTGLIESFTVTLEDAIFSHLIIHVWDVSNPDSKKQIAHVMSTLKNLDFGEDLSNKAFVVGNKVDRISESELLVLQTLNPDMFFVSTKTGYGMENMLKSLQSRILKASGRFRMKIRVKSGGEEFEWLCKEFAVEDMQVENDSKFTLLTVIGTKAQFDIFKHTFL